MHDTQDHLNTYTTTTTTTHRHTQTHTHTQRERERDGGRKSGKKKDNRKKYHGRRGHLMWDSPLYAFNMLYCHWLIKKMFSVNSLTV